VTVALLGKPRGNRGEITALALSSKPERYRALGEVYLSGSGGTFHVDSAWFHQGTLILKFRGVDTIEEAERLRGSEVRIPMSERVPLDPGEFFVSELVGCEIVDRTGAVLGRVSGWEDSGGTGQLVVDDDWLIPFVRHICVDIDPAARRITVELPEGLKDLNRS